MMVSVWITTYNHEKFIEQALESVLNQQTNFDFEIVIGEDCSQDKTREILLRYKAQYPEKIKLFLPEKNLGMNPMFFASYVLCNGKYIAWLDGDDYWTDAYKLQKQVDFLEQNPAYVMCFHRVKILDEIRNVTYVSDEEAKNSDNTLTIDHFLEIRNPVDAVSVMHRNVLDKEFPEWFKKLPFLDLGFYFLLLEHGIIKQLKGEMAVYRYHKTGVYQGDSEYNNFNQLRLFFEILKENIDPAFKDKIQSTLCKLSLILCRMNINSGKFSEAWKNFTCLKANGFKGVKAHLLNSLKMATPAFIKRPFKIAAALLKKA